MLNGEINGAPNSAPLARDEGITTGRVHRFYAPAGIGKISADDGTSVNFHINDVRNATTVRQGQRVQFDKQRDNRPERHGRLEARRIVVIDLGGARAEDHVARSFQNLGPSLRRAIPKNGS